MNQRLAINLALAGAIIVLALVVILEPGKEATPDLPKITALNPEHVMRITVERAGRDTLVFEKQADASWRMTQPLILRANDFRVSALARAAQTGSHAHFPQTGRDLKQFELDAPKIKLTLNDQIIEFGGVNPLDNRRYVRVADTVHLIGDDVFFRLNGEAAGYISSALIPEHTQELSEIKLPGKTMSRDASSGKWTVAPPVADLTPDDINTFLDEWRHAQALQVSAYNGTPSGEQVTLSFSSTTPPLIYDVLGKDGDLILGRKDAGVQYQLTAEARQKLFELKHASDEKPKEGSAGSAK